MDTWDLNGCPWRPHRPEILVSTEEGRAIVLDLPAGEQLQDHQVHEGAWITVVRGQLSITSEDARVVEARVGTLVRLAPQERHEVRALTDARLLLLLTPWPETRPSGVDDAAGKDRCPRACHRAARRALLAPSSTRVASARTRRIATSAGSVGSPRDI